MRCGMLLKFGGPTADEIALDAFQWIDWIAQVPFFVLLSDVGIARWRFSGDFVLEFIQVILEKVLVDALDRQAALVADRADEDLLPVGILWTRRRRVVGTFSSATIVIVVVAIDVFVDDVCFGRFHSKVQWTVERLIERGTGWRHGRG